MEVRDKFNIKQSVKWTSKLDLSWTLSKVSSKDD